MNFENLYNILQEFAEVFTEKYKEELKTKRASGSLADSVKYTIGTGNNSYYIEVSLLDYWKFVEEGRKPGSKFPPIDVIKEWVRIKQIVIRPDASRRMPTENQLSFLIARGIAEKGIPATNFFSNSFESTYKEFENKIISSFGSDLELMFNELLSNSLVGFDEIQLL